MLRLRVKAPFAAFRTFTAGSYRPTAPFITPSAAYGLILNLAGIESRYDDGKSPMTLMRNDLPAVEIALGAVRFPEVQSLYQQLHNYPVGNTGIERAPQCKGAKYNIQPIRREYLSGFDSYICLRDNKDLESRVRSGLREGACSDRVDGCPRYGIPFLGDNSFMVDILREESVVEQPAYWYLRLGPQEAKPRVRRFRLTVWIDRKDMTQTIAPLFTFTEKSSPEPPDNAWTRILPLTGGREAA
jgi:CRISPR-associated protein Cas5t